jgi:hypothetical protein
VDEILRFTALERSDITNISFFIEGSGHPGYAERSKICIRNVK